MSLSMVMKTVTVDVDGAPVKIWAGEILDDASPARAAVANVIPGNSAALLHASANTAFFTNLSAYVGALRQRGANEAECDATVLAAVVIHG